VVLGSLDTVTGGHLYDRKLVRHLRDQGDTVEVVTLEGQSYPALLRLNRDPNLRERLASLPVDVFVQDESVHPAVYRLNAWLKAQHPAPILSLVHHLRVSEQHPWLARLRYRRVERAYHESVDGFIFNSQTTRRSVEALLGRSVPGVVATPAGDQFGVRISAEQVRERSRQPGDLRLLFAGSVIPRKELHVLVDALAQVQPPRWRLAIAGDEGMDPAYAAQVRAAIDSAGLAGRVTYCGKLSSFRMRQELQDAQVLVVPSSYEGFGIAYLEAMGFGVVPVGCTTGAAGEIIQPDENGLLVPYGDAAALSEVIRGLIEDRARLERLSLAAWTRFADFPGWDESLATIRAYLQQVVERR
jgi:glycosyltransferase involved in cell wall biosynthesis